VSVEGNRQAPTPYLDALVALRDDRDPLRLMVPGHKPGLGVSPRLRKALGASALEMLGLDIPLHVRGIDVAPPGSDSPAAVAYACRRGMARSPDPLRARRWLAGLGRGQGRASR
jgi:hypothetical protein